MMKFFRMHDEPQPPSPWKYVAWGGIILLIVGSFILQMALGFCPVP